MPTHLVHLAVDAIDPDRLARFWAIALGWQIGPADDEERDVRPAGYRYPDPSALPLVFVPVPERKTGKNRIHLDLATSSTEHQAGLVARLIALGARPARIGQRRVPWQVLADPEGNEFCVLEPRPVYSGTGPVAAVVADCADPRAVAGFWQQATGWIPADSVPDGVSLRSPAGTGPYLELLRSDDVKAVKNRVHLDVAPGPGEDHAAAVRALIEAGAVPADVGQGQVSWAVLADPQGSEFCVLSPR
jgi:hypothetical protein